MLRQLGNHIRVYMVRWVLKRKQLVSTSMFGDFIRQFNLEKIYLE